MSTIVTTLLMSSSQSWDTPNMNTALLPMGVYSRGMTSKRRGTGLADSRNSPKVRVVIGSYGMHTSP
jgi:hypothetical protein